MRILYDYQNNEVNIGDKLRREKLDKNQSIQYSDYYIYKLRNNKPYLIKLDESGNETANSFDNIYVDGGIKLSYNQFIRWIKVV